MEYTATLDSLNGSGVTGEANLSLDGSELTVQIQAEGLVPGQPHPQHIHGRFGDDGEPMDSVNPTPAVDADGDGFIEVPEGANTYGAILLPLTSPPGGAVADFPTADDGTLDFMQVYNLDNDEIFNGDFSSEDLFSLDLREIVLHGMTVPEGVGAGTPNEVNGEGGYNPLVPAASGEIREVAQVPEPASIALLTGGLMAFGGRRLAKRRHTTG
ncbi:PEP-CTERM sorting domain-containing protein [Marinobacter fonticola]|uniref:PEP-CTERM sorting domain-containing protein n=1 Tax=Marinobacter fonticola TaxID=2603215 RepID=UPI0011E7BEB1|nr:PEP-CTERM sorting domain-containing protein [Marinobacter fonticola]